MARPEVELDPERSALHRFGFELRAWRKARGLTQAVLGSRIHVSDDLVRLIETGQRRPSHDLAERCDEVLDACGLFVRLWESAETERQTDKAAGETDNQAGTAAGSLARDATSGIIVPVDRRTFLSVSAAVPAFGLSAAHTPVVLDGGGVTDVLTAMAKLRRALSAQDNVLGAGAVLPAALHEVGILEALGRRCAGQDRERVTGLSAAYAEFIGWLTDDLGDRDGGQYWTDRALQWAHEADDEVMVGYVLMRKAQRAVADGDPAAAVALARSAGRHAASPRIEASALQHEAQGHAAEGDEAAFRAAIDTAHTLIASATSAVEGERATWCTPGYVLVGEADGWARLHQPARAASLYEQALATWPGAFRRDEAVYLGRLARAYAEAGEPERSVKIGDRALALAGGTGSARALGELKPLPTALAKWRSNPSIRELTRAISTSTTTIVTKNLESPK